MCMAQRIWINTGNGKTTLLTGLCGRLGWRPAGLPIGMAAGFGRTTMVGLGSAPILGVGRRITMAVGSWVRVAAGAGIQDRFMRGIIGRRLSSVSSDMAEA